MQSLTSHQIDFLVSEQAQLGMSLNFMHMGQANRLHPGLYFGMPEDLYHAIPALSSTGLKNLKISAPDFYFNSWLNPNRIEDQEDDDKAKDWQTFGKATHCRICEGRKTFDSLYCVEYLPPEGCLESVNDMKSWVKMRGIDTKGCTSKNGETPSKWVKADWIDFVLGIDPNALIADVEKEKYYRETGGRIQLTQRDMRRIAIAAAMVENHPELRHAFTGGYPEVTVIWHEDDQWFKARFDYLKPRAFVDLKTFTNKRHKPIDMALHETMGAMKYHIQLGLYSRGAEWASGFARAGITTTYSIDRFGPDANFLSQLGETGAAGAFHDAYHVYTKKGGAPLARGKKFPRNLNMMACANASIDQAIELYKKYYALFGNEAWVDTASISDYEDALFPVYTTEI